MTVGTDQSAVGEGQPSGGTGFVRPDHAERFVSFRQARAQRLTNDEPLTLHAVIGEAALRRAGAGQR